MGGAGRFYNVARQFVRGTGHTYTRCSWWVGLASCYAVCGWVWLAALQFARGCSAVCGWGWPNLKF